MSLSVNEFDELFPKIRLEEFKKLPIPNDDKFSNELAEIVSQIISHKSKDINYSTSSLEDKLDRLVYKMYNLTESEIKIIESK